MKGNFEVEEEIRRLESPYPGAEHPLRVVADLDEKISRLQFESQGSQAARFVSRNDFKGL